MALAEAGCHTLIHYGRSEGPARETQAEAEAFGTRSVVHSADLADGVAAAGVIPAAVRELGGVDILINSAAIFLEGDFEGTTVEMWESQFAINLRAPFLLSQAFARQVLAEGQGKIVNILDARIFRPASDHFAYRLTKAALLAMTEALAQELAPRINVNAVALGAILPPPGKDESYLRDLAESAVPLKTHGSANIVAENVVHLLRQDFLTGVTVRIDGGQFL